MNVGTLRQRAYERIRGELISGRLRPGSRISEPSLAGQLGIGRTPVREAIQQLQLEGLLERMPRRGTVVRTPRRVDIVDLYQLREGLESYAVVLATEQIGPADLATLGTLCEQTGLSADQFQQTGLEAWDAAMMRRFLAADMAFHMLLIRAAGNRQIMKIVGDSHVMSRIFGTSRHEHDLRVVSQTCRQHNDILRAVKDSDGKLARQLMAEHIRGSLQQTLEYFDRMQAEADGHRPIPLDLPKELLKELNRIEKELGTDDSEQTMASQNIA